MDSKFNNKLTLNKPYDEEVWLEETTSEDLEKAADIERECEDDYDNSFTKLMVEQFPHLTNPYYISSPDSDSKKSDVFVFQPPTPPKNSSEVEEYIDIEANPYEHEDAMEYEQRLKQLIKRRKETGYYEKKIKKQDTKN